MADTYALVNDQNFSTTYVIDLTTKTIINTFTPSTPGEIAVLPNATEAYFTNGGALAGLLYTLPLPSPPATLGPSISVGNQPGIVVASPDGTHVYSASPSTNVVTPVATPSNVAGSPITISGTSNVEAMAINPASTELYATTLFAGIYPIAIPSNVVGVPFLTAIQWGGIVVMPGGLTGYATASLGGFLGLYPLDLVALTAGTFIPTTCGGGGVPFLQPGGSHIYMTDDSTNQVIVVDTTTNAQVAAIPLTPGGGASNSGGFDSAGTMFYDCDVGSGNVWYIDTASMSVVDHMFIGGDPRFIAVVPVPFIPPPTPTYPGSVFIPKLFIPQKGKINRDYTPDELMANWIAIEIWSQGWKPAAPTLFFPHKNSSQESDLDANWVVMEEWVQQIIQAMKAPYPVLFIPRKSSNVPTDLDVDFLRAQNWANSLP